ncbi:hypothetical protein UK12_34285, partial [Saccharothrix sp. ST-888]
RIFNLMQDASTAHISRSQICQWIHNGLILAHTGEKATAELLHRLVAEQLCLPEEFAYFLTRPAYQLLGSAPIHPPAARRPSDRPSSRRRR